MLYKLDGHSAQEITQIAGLYEQIAAGNLQNYFQLAHFVKGTSEEISRVIVASMGSRKHYDYLMKKEASRYLVHQKMEAGQENIDDVLDHPVSRGFLMLETGTNALIKSKEFEEFISNHPQQDLTKLPAYQWEKLMRKTHFGHMLSVNKELLLNFRLEHSPGTSIDTLSAINGYRDNGMLLTVRDIIHNHRGYSTAEGIKDLYEMGDDQRITFMQSYHAQGQVPIEMTTALKQIVDFILYANEIRNNLAGTKAA